MTPTSIASPEPSDCLVVGAGPAGLTAALYLARFRRQIRIVDEGASRAALIPRSRNLPGFRAGLHGADLIEALTQQVGAYGVTVERARLTRIAVDAGVFVADLGAAACGFRTVLLATGVAEVIPPIAGVADAMRRGTVRVCPICDGFEAQDRSVGVLGEGDHAAREALFLRTFSADVALVLPPERSVGAARAAELAAAGIAVHHADLASFKVGPDGVSAICAEAGREVQFDILYAAFGVAPQVSLARDLGVDLDEDHRIRVGDHQDTSVDGVFAAGDVVRGLNQICVAEGEAAIAASAIHNRLARNLR